MSALWGIHNDQSSLDLIAGGFISIGWDDLGHPSTSVIDREMLKLGLAESRSEAKP